MSDERRTRLLAGPVALLFVAAVVFWVVLFSMMHSLMEGV